MKYTVRVAHLESLPDHAIGDIISTGDLVGRMGNTGHSTAPHVHIDCVHGFIKHVYHQRDIESGVLMPAFEQLAWFIDYDFFGYDIVITTGVADPEYLRKEGKLHMGFDVVPKNRHLTKANFNFSWNRTPDAELLVKGFDSGYGIYAHYGFEV